MWKSIKKICELNKSKDASSSLLQSKPTIKESLNFCNEYFVQVGSNLASNILNGIRSTEEDLAALVSIPFQSSSSFFMSPTNSSEILCLIKDLRNSCAPGIDGITNNLLKTHSHLFIEPLTHVMNLSLSSGVFPLCWKAALVIPIHKAGSKTLPSNYRPISLLSVFSKLLEKLVNSRVTKYLEQYKVLSPCQFGFRRARSTEDAVHTLLEGAVSALDCGKKCIGVFLDLAKAFDTVSPKILLRKLECLGIRGVALDWFNSYLSQRSQCVSVDGQRSEFLNIRFGVPQGSILGPTLFTIYINDLIGIFKDSVSTKIVCYADDTAIIFMGETWAEASQRAEKGLALVSEWLNANLLTLNSSKTKFLCFHKTRVSAPSNLNSLQIHKSPPSASCPSGCSCPLIERSATIRYLGLLLDENLNFKSHISELAGRVRKMIHIMKLLREGSDIETLKLVFTALCQSILGYCITVWGGAAKTHMITVERAQRSVLKVMCRLPFRFPTTALYASTQILTVRQLYIHRVITAYHQTYRLQSSSAPPSSSRRLKVKVPSVKTKFAKRFKYHSYPFIYRCASKHCELTCSLYGVKEKIRRWLLTLDYDNTESLLATIA